METKSLSFMTGNPQLGMSSGILEYFPNNDVCSNPLKDSDGLPRRKSLQDSLLLSQTSTSDSLSGSRSVLLCITAVPAHLVPTDMMQFVAPFRSAIEAVRVLRPCSSPGAPMEYMVLLEMHDQESADNMFLQYNGKLFTSMEESRCHMVFVSSICFDSDSDLHRHHDHETVVPPSTPLGGSKSNINTTTPRSACGASPAITSLHQKKHLMVCGTGPHTPCSPMTPPPVPLQHAGGRKESIDVCGGLSTCVICMEKLESQVLTTVCNHSFHIDCLIKWEDSPCPVCRFHHNSASEESTCQDCGAVGGLWVCLICGFVGCGGVDVDGHTRHHYERTLHAYALDIDTQQVWDFAGGGFVHRLMTNKVDGKLVEVADPRTAPASGERPRVPLHLSDLQEEELIHGKLEGLARQYNTLLASQLEEQRRFYQTRINQMMEERDERAKKKSASGSDLVAALKQDCRQLEQKCQSLSERLKKTRAEVGFQLELQRSLEANRIQWEEEGKVAEKEAAAVNATAQEWIPKLEDKVAQLMAKLDGANSSSGVSTTSTSTAQKEESSSEKGPEEVSRNACGSQKRPCASSLVPCTPPSGKVVPPAAAAARMSTPSSDVECEEKVPARSRGGKRESKGHR